MLNLLIGIGVAIILYELSASFFILSIPIIFMLGMYVIKKQKIFLITLLVFILTLINCNLYSQKSNIKNFTTSATVVSTYSNNENKFLIKNKGLKLILYTKEDLKIGDVINLSGSLKDIAPKLNRVDFDYKNYLKGENIAGIVQSNDIKVVGVSKYYKLVNNFINYINSNLHNLLEEENANLMSAVMLSDTGLISKESRDLYSEVGLSHVLAMSGLHIGLIIMIFESILKLLPISKIYRRIISLAMTFIYIMLIGFPIGALRAFMMASLLFMSFLFKQKYSTLDGLLFSAIVILLINPYSVYSISFSLSFLSVLGIVLFHSRIYSKLKKNFINSGLSLTLAVTIMIFPISCYYFGGFSILGIISNITVLPMLSLAIVISYFMIIIFPISFVMAPTVNILINISNFFILKISSIKFLNIDFKIFFVELILIYLIIGFYFKINQFKEYYVFNKVLFKYSYLMLAINLLWCIIYINNSSEINFIYVDQGDSALIRDGNIYSMVDTGGSINKDYRVGKKYTLSYLKSKGIKKLENLFISHYDEDHIEGLLDIIDEIEIKNIYVPYFEDNVYTKAISARNINLFDIEENDAIKVNNAYFKCLFDGDLYSKPNDRSMVLLREDGGFKTLFTGDIESSEIEISYDIDLLKVSHHGSRTSTSLDFLERCTPKYAAISSGFQNKFSHPHEEVLNNLNKENVKYFNTGEDGEITLEKYGDSVKFYSYRNIKTNYYLFAIIIVATLIIGLIFIRGEYFELQRRL